MVVNQMPVYYISPNNINKSKQKTNFGKAYWAVVPEFANRIDLTQPSIPKLGKGVYESIVTKKTPYSLENEISGLIKIIKDLRENAYSYKSKSSKENHYSYLNPVKEFKFENRYDDRYVIKLSLPNPEYISEKLIKDMKVILYILDKDKPTSESQARLVREYSVFEDKGNKTLRKFYELLRNTVADSIPSEEKSSFDSAVKALS